MLACVLAALLVPGAAAFAAPAAGRAPATLPAVGPSVRQGVARLGPRRLVPAAVVHTRRTSELQMQELPFWENGERALPHTQPSLSPSRVPPLSTLSLSAVARYVRFFFTASTRVLRSSKLSSLVGR